jgi:hypothetical protein
VHNTAETFRSVRLARGTGASNWTFDEAALAQRLEECAARFALAALS